jgi:K+-transporting ATPase A subunit
MFRTILLLLAQSCWSWVQYKMLCFNVNEILRFKTYDVLQIVSNLIGWSLLLIMRSLQQFLKLNDFSSLEPSFSFVNY